MAIRRRESGAAIEHPGGSNTATGYQSLYHSIGAANAANGQATLVHHTLAVPTRPWGCRALGEHDRLRQYRYRSNAGSGLTTGSNNIDIGNVGVRREASTVRIGTTGTQTNTYIAGISGVTVAGGIGVIVDSNGHLGTSTSSARYKEASSRWTRRAKRFSRLKPVTFRYKKELDPKAIPQFGLVAEQVEKVDPELRRARRPRQALHRPLRSRERDVTQ